ncbi:MAG: threonine dehydratase [Rhodospirillaceae bacterium]|nr:threonine dehydratase [Rhodospirillaceae bacterium]
MAHLPTLAEMEAAATLIARSFAPTPQYCWPLLCQRVGTQVWVKHENHTPTGAFKVRGGLVYIDRLKAMRPQVRGIIAATRGNHGQSLAYAARQAGLACVICVPHGNSVEKNRAMQALGAELIEHGDDFQAALDHARTLAPGRGLHAVPSFDPLLVAGVGTYGMELLRAVPGLDTVYVPIGLGSGICGVAAAREALGHKVEIVGVVSTQAPAYARSFAQRRPIDAPVTTLLADGMACRVPDADALDLILRHVDRVISVTDDDVAAAMRALFTDTHNVAEGAGAAPLAALLQDRARAQGRSVGIVLSGGNVDARLFARILDGPPGTPGSMAD